MPQDQTELSKASLDSLRRQRIVSLARSFIGTRFHHQGRVPGVGLDCGGVVVCAADADNALWMEDEQRYSRQPWSKRLKVHCQRVLQELPSFSEAQAGSIILFWIHRPKIQQHLGILTGEGTFVHSWWHVRKVVESPLDAYFTERIDSCYDYKLRSDGNIHS